MKVTYWRIKCLDDHVCYSIRAATKKACLAEYEARGYSRADLTDDYCGSWRKPEKVVIEYKSAFDLVAQITGEDGEDCFAE